MEIIGRGTTACILKYPDNKPKPEVVKVVTQEVTDNEQTVWGVLERIDKAQSYFFYPVSMKHREITAAEREKLRECNKTGITKFLNPEAPKAYFITMPEGGDSLYSRKKSGALQLEPEDIIEHMKHLVTAVDKLWAAGYAHGDIHVHNVVFSKEDGWLRLIDFGKACELNPITKERDRQGIASIFQSLLPATRNDENVGEKVECLKTLLKEFRKRNAGQLTTNALGDCVKKVPSTRNKGASSSKVGRSRDGSSSPESKSPSKRLRISGTPPKFKLGFD